MDKWICEPCGYVYDPDYGDPDSGIEPGTPFEDIPEDWVCPVCGVEKKLFRKRRRIINNPVIRHSVTSGVLLWKDAAFFRTPLPHCSTFHGKPDLYPLKIARNR